LNDGAIEAKESGKTICADSVGVATCSVAAWRQTL